MLVNTTIQTRTFPVSAVTEATTPMNCVTYKDAVTVAIGRMPEAFSISRKRVVPCEGLHGFVHAVNAAFDDHRPLCISPDHIWLVLCQGLANHVLMNESRLRRHFVPFDGKKTLIVHRDEFKKGSPHNDWESVWPDFLQQMSAYMGENANLMNPEFTTTDVIERSACMITMMRAMKNFFEYEVHTKCGIPSITLEGTEGDWDAILTKVQLWEQLDLGWWLSQVMPVLERFKQAVAGQDDPTWWQSFYKVRSVSGGRMVDGHINALFPYVVRRGDYTNDWAKKLERRDDFDVSSMENFPPGMAACPFIWEYFSDRLPYEFYAGFVGSTQHGVTLRPEIGWAVNPVVVPERESERAE